MARPTKAQQNGHKPLDAAYVHATGKVGYEKATTWDVDADYSVVPRVLNALEGVGGALQLGRSRDGRQLVIRVFIGNERPAYYFDSTEQAMEFLEAVVNVGGAL